MDRKETGAPKSEYANDRVIDSGTARTLGSPTGREEDPRAEANPAADDMMQPIGAQPRSEVTGAHDPGSGANETQDGLDETEEMTRREAEDEAPGLADVDAEADDTPVFDRAEEEHL